MIIIRFAMELRWTRLLLPLAVLLGSATLFQNCGNGLKQRGFELSSINHALDDSLGFPIIGLDANNRGANGNLLLQENDNTLSTNSVFVASDPVPPADIRRIDITIALDQGKCVIRSAAALPIGFYFKEDGKIFGTFTDQPPGSTLPEVDRADRGKTGYDFNIIMQTQACKWQRGTISYNQAGAAVFTPDQGSTPSNRNGVLRLAQTLNTGVAKTSLVDFRVDRINPANATIDANWLSRVISLGTDTGFDDVRYDSAFGPYAQAARMFKLALGYGNRTFGPNDPVRRSQMVAFITRWLSEGYDKLPTDCPLLTTLNFSDRNTVGGFCGTYQFLLKSLKDLGKTDAQIKTELSAAKFLKSQTELGPNDTLTLAEVTTMLTYFRTLSAYAIPVTPPTGAPATGPLSRGYAIMMLMRYNSPFFMPF